MVVEITIDDQKFKEKPRDGEVKKALFGRIAGERRKMRVREIAEAVGEQGRTFCPANFIGKKRSKETFSQMQFFAVDFDNGMTYNEVRERAEKYGLPVCFSYWTFSSSAECEKFRLVFLHKCPVKERKAAEIIIGMLMKIFEGCDKNCSDVSRAFYGGKGLIEYSDGIFGIDQLAVAVQRYMKDHESSQYKRNLGTFAKKIGLAINGSSLAIKRVLRDGEEKENVDPVAPDYLYITDESPGSTWGERYVLTLFHQTLIRTLEKEERATSYKIKDLEGRGRCCRLFDEFISGKDIGHDGRFLVITNMLHIRGGIHSFLDIIKKYGYDFDKWKETGKYISDNCYHPTCCAKCSYCAECKNRGTMFATIRENRDRHVDVIGQEEYISLEQGEKMLLGNFQKALEGTYKGIYLIKAQTALGKTEVYCKVIAQEQDKRFVIALPTNKLKEEVYGRLQGNGVVAEKTLSIDEAGFPDEVRKRIYAGYRAGMPQTSKIIRDYLKKHKGREDTGTAMCRRYLNCMKELGNARVIVTTHARLFTFDEEFLEPFTVIVDEDILLSYCLNQVNSVSTDVLKRFCEDSLADSFLKGRAKRMLDAPEGKYVKLQPLFSRWYPAGDMLDGEESYEGNIYGIAGAGAFVKQDDKIDYYCPPRLPKAKYIIMSATLEEGLYRDYFPDMWMKCYEQPPVRYKGKLVQYTYHSMSRKDLEDKNEQVKEFAENLIGKECERITFKKYAEGSNREGLYYGNQEGCDGLKGKNLVLIGTPYTVDFHYKLIACYLDAEVNGKEDKQPHRERVHYKGYSFLHSTYKNIQLRKIQMYFIYSELEQAVGRARLLREDCTVVLFSSFPCAQADIREEDYLDNKYFFNC